MEGKEEVWGKWGGVADRGEFPKVCKWITNTGAKEKKVVVTTGNTFAPPTVQMVLRLESLLISMPLPPRAACGFLM